MPISIQMAIMSHLSNAQDVLRLFQPEQAIPKSTQSINFAKLLLLTYPDVRVVVDTDDLDNLWSETFKK